MNAHIDKCCGPLGGGAIGRSSTGLRGHVDSDDLTGRVAQPTSAPGCSRHGMRAFV